MTFRYPENAGLSKGGLPDDCLKRFIGVILNTKYENNKKRTIPYTDNTYL